MFLDEVILGHVSGSLGRPGVEILQLCTYTYMHTGFKMKTNKGKVILFGCLVPGSPALAAPPWGKSDLLFPS